MPLHRDGNYPARVDAVLADAGITVVRSGVRVPLMNAGMQRWVKGDANRIREYTEPFEDQDDVTVTSPSKYNDIGVDYDTGPSGTKRLQPVIAAGRAEAQELAKEEEQVAELEAEAYAEFFTEMTEGEGEGMQGQAQAEELELEAEEEGEF